MRRKKILTLTLMLSIAMLSSAALSSCGPVDEDTPDSSSAEKIKAAAAESVPEETDSETDTSSEETESEDDTSSENTESAEAVPTEQRVFLDLSASDRPEVISAELSGISAEEPRLENIYGSHILASGTTGLFGCPVMADFSSGSYQLVFTIDENNSMGVTADDLIILCNDDEQYIFDEIKSTAYENTVSAEISVPGEYMLVSRRQWYSAWGIDIDDGAKQSILRNTEFGFSVMIPSYIAYSDVSDYWEPYQTMFRKQLIHQNNISSDTAYIDAAACRYAGADEADQLIMPAPQIPLEQNVRDIKEAMKASDVASSEILTDEEITLSDGRKGYILQFHFEPDTKRGIDEQYSVIGYFEYSDDIFISISYRFTNESTGGITEAIDCLKTFDYIK